MQGLAGASPTASLGGKALKLRPGSGTHGQGFHANADASALASGPIAAKFNFAFRGNGMLTLQTNGGETNWKVNSAWQSPSFKGLLPVKHVEGKDGFTANWQIGGLTSGGFSAEQRGDALVSESVSRVAEATSPVGQAEARVDLFEPVDIYSQVDRAVKYGFLFVGFTFVAFLMFDVIGGVRVSLVEYLLVGAGLVMFFILLLALAEVIGFGVAYALASASDPAAAALRSLRN